MPALKDEELDALCIRIGQMSEAHRNHVRLGLSHDDVLHLFVQPEDQAVVLRCRELFETRRKIYREITNEGILYWLEVNEEDGVCPFPFPSYVTEPLETAPEELVHTLVEAQHEIEEICLRYGHLKLVLTALDQLCKNPAQLRFFFPPIEALANGMNWGPTKNNLLKRMNTRYREPLPALPPELRAEVDTAAGTVTGYGMLPLLDRTPDPVEISAYSPRAFKGSCSIGEYTGL